MAGALAGSAPASEEDMLAGTDPASAPDMRRLREQGDSLDFVPMAFIVGAGAEVQGPFATVRTGGAQQ